jgi:IS30 family transposase
MAEQRHKNKPKSVKLTEEIKQLIQGYVKQDWSPEQVAGRLETEGIMQLHHATIYQYILVDKAAGGTLYKHPRPPNKTYLKRYGSVHNRTGIPKQVDIEQRPEEANERQRVGDREADTIIAKNHKGAIVTLDDRRSKLRLAAPLQSKKAQDVKPAAIALLQPIKPFVKTISFDSGKEFTLHEPIVNALECETYFAKPYHSWERGQNENANGLLRQYFPKTMELVDVSMKQVFEAVDNLNSRLRKCLGFKTPYEAFEELTGVNIKNVMGYGSSRQGCESRREQVPLPSVAR